jgi:MoaA/NifB/PqqE/SkfB family radical SAM enzyme
MKALFPNWGIMKEEKRRQLRKIMGEWKTQKNWEVEEADWNDTEKGREYKNFWFYKRPKGINIDITHRCPLECPSCQRQTEFLNHGKKVHGYDLDLSDIEKLAKYYHQFNFCGQLSDPVHHPKFIEMLKILRRYDCTTSIHNASTFKSIKWYIEAFKAYPENTKWIFAIDGLPEESHKYRINQDGPKMFQILLEAKKHLHLTPSWQFIIFSYNEHNVEKAKQMAFDNGLGFIEVQSSRWSSKDDPLIPKSQKYRLDTKR